MLRTGVGLAVVAVCFLWLLPSFASYGEVLDRLALSEIGVAGGLLLTAVVLANLISPSLSQVAALPGLSLRRAVWADWSTTTVTNLIPGGSAISIGLIWSMYRSFGLATTAIARSVVVTGVWDVLVKLGTPLLALMWLAADRADNGGLAPNGVDGALVEAALFGGALFIAALILLAVVLTGPGTAAFVGRFLDRLPLLPDGWPGRLEALRIDTAHLLRSRGPALTVSTVAGHANLYLLLVLCLRAVGVGNDVMGWAAVLAAFAFGRLVTALPLTPGGLGVMEVGLTGALGVVGDAPAASVVAGVLLFRAFSFALPLPLGAVGLAIWSAAGPSPEENPVSVGPGRT